MHKAKERDRREMGMLGPRIRRGKSVVLVGAVALVLSATVAVGGASAGPRSTTTVIAAPFASAEHDTYAYCGDNVPVDLQIRCQRSASADPATGAATFDAKIDSGLDGELPSRQPKIATAGAFGKLFAEHTIAARAKAVTYTFNLESDPALARNDAELGTPSTRATLFAGATHNGKNGLAASTVVSLPSDGGSTSVSVTLRASGGIPAGVVRLTLSGGVRVDFEPEFFFQGADEPPGVDGLIQGVAHRRMALKLTSIVARVDA